MAGGPSTARSPAQTRRSASRWLGANETHGGWCGCGRHGHRHELWRGLHRWTRWTAGQLGHDARRDSTVVATSGSGEACPRRSDDEECGGGGGGMRPIAELGYAAAGVASGGGGEVVGAHNASTGARRPPNTDGDGGVAGGGDPGQAARPSSAGRR
jgi:hypothetical protein